MAHFPALLPGFCRPAGGIKAKNSRRPPCFCATRPAPRLPYKANTAKSITKTINKRFSAACSALPAARRRR